MFMRFKAGDNIVIVSIERICTLHIIYTSKLFYQGQDMWSCGPHRQYIPCDEDLDCMTHDSYLSLKLTVHRQLVYFKLFSIFYGQHLSLLIRKY